uniref:Uncharacterized protein n=1 Tax=Siphoviridae sp. ct3Mm15 TaxID=2827558 RepID=A0A8S5RSW9_9CAUD|nr:MAG TPA: hypothetical protein [Siphoviridae sp. ct3Mm15]
MKLNSLTHENEEEKVQTMPEFGDGPADAKPENAENEGGN